MLGDPVHRGALGGGFGERKAPLLLINTPAPEGEFTADKIVHVPWSAQAGAATHSPDPSYTYNASPSLAIGSAGSCSEGRRHMGLRRGAAFHATPGAWACDGTVVAIPMTLTKKIASAAAHRSGVFARRLGPPVRVMSKRGGRRSITHCNPWSEWQDSNLRPPRPERGALPG
jgi:hypothetical protein